MGSVSRAAVILASSAALAVGGATAAVFAIYHGSGPASHSGVTHVTAALPPLRVVSVSPADGSRDVNGTKPVIVTFNRPLPAGRPFPRLLPSVPGTWARSGNTAVFTPAGGFPGSTSVRVTVPGAGPPPSPAATATPPPGKTATLSPSGAATSPSGAATSPSGTTTPIPGATAVPSPGGTTTPAPRSPEGTATPAPRSPGGYPPGSRARGPSEFSSRFVTAPYSTLRMQELLAELGYLPMTWTARRGGAVVADRLAAQAAAAFRPPEGSFRWRDDYPGQLRGMWTQGTPNQLDTGAIAGFEAGHGLTVDGQAGSAFWAALLKAAVAGKRNANGYSYAVVSESSPETLTIWHNGRQVFSSLANTGIASRPTATGTFFVYEKLPFQIMQGTNPDGSHYSDPVQWVSYFNGGDAVHYFPRYSFGWPQSLGCVELPLTEAQRSYQYLPYGTLVSVNA